MQPFMTSFIVQTPAVADVSVPGFNTGLFSTKKRSIVSNTLYEMFSALIDLFDNMQQSQRCL